MKTSLPLMHYEDVTVVDVHDGDTISVRVRVDCGFNAVSEFNIKLRFLGMDCPELHQGTDEEKAKGEAAKQFTLGYLPVGKKIQIDTAKDRQTFGRWLGIIWVDNINLNDLLVKTGHAVPFMV